MIVVNQVVMIQIRSIQVIADLWNDAKEFHLVLILILAIVVAAAAAAAIVPMMEERKVWIHHAVRIVLIGVRHLEGHVVGKELACARE